MRPDQMAGCKSGVQRELTSKDGSGNNAGKLAGIITRIRWMSASHTEEIKHGGLGFENCAATDCADLNRRHGN
jgi:hypothetical protein